MTDVYHLDQKIDKIKKVLEADLTEVYMAIKIGGYRPQNRTENPRSAVDKARYACGLIKNKYGESYKEFNEDISTEYNRRQYVVNNIDNAVTKDIIRVIIELAERIGMKTVAEGVENEEEARFLKEAGCERLQGYFFGKPVPFETFIAKIPDQKNQTDASAGL